MSKLSSTPFVIKLFEESIANEDLSLFPATYRDQDENVAELDVEKFITKDLSIKRLEHVHSWLWMAGRPMPPRHLIYQQMVKREITITEQADMHLTWQNGRMFLKPLPKYLLDAAVWEHHLSSKPELCAIAKGFLLSYCALVVYESDFVQATKLGLLPEPFKWHQWQCWAREFVQRCDYGDVHPRFWYGELRLNRLNTIYQLRGHLLRGYATVDSPATYSQLLNYHFAALFIILGYVVVILSGFQAGLATTQLSQSDAFQQASVWFTVLAMIAPVGAVVVILLLVIVMIAANWAATLSFEKHRARKMRLINIRHSDVRETSDTSVELSELSVAC